MSYRDHPSFRAWLNITAKTAIKSGTVALIALGPITVDRPHHNAPTEVHPLPTSPSLIQRNEITRFLKGSLSVLYTGPCGDERDLRWAASFAPRDCGAADPALTERERRCADS